jgi:hypothetical protein
MAECHPDRVHQAFGLCAPCYMKQYDRSRSNAKRRKDPSDYSPNYRRPPSKPKRNADCHPNRPHVALGMCRSCYQKDRPGRPRAECHPDRPLVAKGMCGMCLSRGQYWNDPEKYKEQSRQAQAKTRQRNRDELIAAYGGRCSCANCPETNSAFLTLEHVNRDGKEHRAEVGSHTYADLRRRGWPQEGYTLLCWNCNAMTRFGRTCPHEGGEDGR